MLHIILIILKIIGILLLVVLGIVLSILLLVLFAPFRYSVDGEKREEIYFHAKVTWVLFFLRVVCSYEKKKLVYYVKVFGYSLVSNEEKKKKAKKKKKEKSLSEEEQLLLSEIEEEAKIQAVELEQMKGQEKLSKKVAKDKEGKKEEFKEEKKETQKEEVEPKIEKKRITSEKKEESICLESKATESEKKDIEKTQTEKRKSEPEQKEKVSKKSEKKWRKNPINIIRNILYKIKDKVCGILEKIRRLFYKLDELREKINGLLERAREWMAFIGEEMTKKATSKLIKIIKKFLKHILPGKIKGNLTFGLEDPAMMGQVLAILGMAMPIYKNSLKIQPCFGVNMIQGDIKAKGKIRLAYLLYLAILVLIDKGIMGTIKKARAMAKGEKESKGGE